MRFLTFHEFKFPISEKETKAIVKCLVAFSTLAYDWRNLGWVTHSINDMAGVVSSIVRGTLIYKQLYLTFIVIWNSKAGLVDQQTRISSNHISVFYPLHFRHGWHSIVIAKEFLYFTNNCKLLWTTNHRDPRYIYIVKRSISCIRN